MEMETNFTVINSFFSLIKSSYINLYILFPTSMMGYRHKFKRIVRIYQWFSVRLRLNVERRTNTFQRLKTKHKVIFCNSIVLSSIIPFYPYKNIRSRQILVHSIQNTWCTYSRITVVISSHA